MRDIFIRGRIAALLGTYLLACALACGDIGDDNGLGSACGPSSAVVAVVLDGDTVELQSGERVRYLGIDTPEIAGISHTESECLADTATAANEALVLGEVIDLTYDQECLDTYDRLLAYVSVGGRMVNEIMLERGYARTMSIPPNTKHRERFAALEDEAQALRMGIWGFCE